MLGNLAALMNCCSLTKLMAVAREFFLLPGRLRFGLVPERSLLSSLGVEDPGSCLSSLDVVHSSSWSTVLYFAGCPSCSKVLRKGDDLISALQMQNSPIRSRGGSEHDLEPALPENKPSVLLSIDRSSDSLEARRKIKEAITDFRNFALQHQTSYGIGGQNNVKTGRPLFGTYQASKSMHGHPPTHQNLAKDKMSLWIKSLQVYKAIPCAHDILAYVLQHKNKVKLSTLSKKVGFELLSEDVDIKIQEALPAEGQVLQSDQVLLNPTEGLPEATI